MWAWVIYNNTFQIGSVDNVISVPKEHSVVREAFVTLVFFCLMFRTLSLYVCKLFYSSTFYYNMYYLL